MHGAGELLAEALVAEGDGCIDGCVLPVAGSALGRVADPRSAPNAKKPTDAIATAAKVT